MEIPEGVTATVKARVVTVKGPRGTITKDFKHLQIELTVAEDGKSLKVARWFTSGKQGAAIRSACSHISNMFIGVTKGFLYKMRFVYAHFPINGARPPPPRQPASRAHTGSPRRRAALTAPSPRPQSRSPTARGASRSATSSARRSCASWRAPRASLSSALPT